MCIHCWMSTEDDGFITCSKESATGLMEVSLHIGSFCRGGWPVLFQAQEKCNISFIFLDYYFANKIIALQGGRISCPVP